MNFDLTNTVKSGVNYPSVLHTLNSVMPPLPGEVDLRSKDGGVLTSGAMQAFHKGEVPKYEAEGFVESGIRN